MSHTLLLFLPPALSAVDSSMQWLLLDEDRRVIARDYTEIHTIHSQIHNLSADYSVVALAPAESVLTVSVEIPSTQLRQIKQALPYMIEELIADDIDNVHLAMATDFRSTLPSVETAVVAHSQLIEWLDALHSNQLSPTAIVVDALCLPFNDNSWTVCVDGDHGRVLIRQSANIGMVLQLADAELILTSLLQTDQQTRGIDNSIAPQLQLIASQTSEESVRGAENIATFLKQQFPNTAVKTSLYQESAVELLSHEWEAQQQRGINLLQTGYAVTTASSNSGAFWGMVASIAFSGIALYMLLALASGWYFDSRADQLERQSQVLYRQLFPSERRVINPRKQLENHLLQSGKGGNASFLTLLAETAKQIPAPLAAGNQLANVSLQQLRFNSEQGDLRFEVTSQSLDQLDQFKNQLLAGGLKVEINSAAEQGSGVLGRIVVSQL